MTMEGMTTRSATMEDVPAVVQLVNAVTVAQWGKPEWTDESLTTFYNTPGFEVGTQIRVWFDSLGVLVAVGCVILHRMPPLRPSVFAFIRPGFAAHTEVGQVIFTWGEATLARIAVPLCPPDLKITMFSRTVADYTPDVRLFEVVGLQPVRETWMMKIDLHADMPLPVLPDGVTIRTIRYPEERHALYRLTDDIFTDQYGHIPDPADQNYEAWAQRRFGSAHFDPSVWFVAEADGKYAGLAWCALGAIDAPQTGWIDNLGVSREFRKQGVGLALLQYVFHAFYARGMTQAGLTVDATSLTGAQRLYQRAGMHIVARWESYAKVIREGVEPLETEVSSGQ